METTVEPMYFISPVGKHTKTHMVIKEDRHAVCGYIPLLGWISHKVSGTQQVDCDRCQKWIKNH